MGFLENFLFPKTKTNSSLTTIIQNIKISFTILTCPRKEPYLEKTIRSLTDTGFFDARENLPLRLVAGSPDPSHLKPYLSDKRFIIDPMGQEEAKEIHWQQSGNALRCAKGHRRCFHPFRSNPGSSFLLVMEDDIRFASGWIPYLHRVLTEITKAFGDKFLLSLNTPGGSADVLGAYKSGRRWTERPYDSFYGTPAILYPLVIRDMFTYETQVRPDDLRNFGPGNEMSRPYGLPIDLMLSKVMKENLIPILTTAPCLVQHIGRISGTDGPWAESKSFLEKV